MRFINLLHVQNLSPPIRKNRKGKVGPYKIWSKNIRIHFSEYVMHMDPTNWVEPKKFNPDRWNDRFNPAAFSYLPFWTGSRGCLGKHLAMMLMKLSLSVLCKNFEMTQAFDLKSPPMINQNMAESKSFISIMIHDEMSC